MTTSLFGYVGYLSGEYDVVWWWREHIVLIVAGSALLDCIVSYNCSLHFLDNTAVLAHATIQSLFTFYFSKDI